MPAEFTRSTCACQSCVALCKKQPGSLRSGDFGRIVAYIEKRDGLSFDDAVKWVKERLWASPGALVMNTATGQTFRIGSITPQMRRGRCVFLTEDDRCSIHPVSPFGCAFFSTHDTKEQAMPKSISLAQSQQEPAYQALRNQLPYARSYRPNRY